MAVHVPHHPGVGPLSPRRPRPSGPPMVVLYPARHQWLHRLNQARKRVVDVVLSALLLLVLLPVFLIIALTIKLDDGGPVFFIQERVGRLGRPFRMIKFRTMVRDAPERLHELFDRNEASGPLFKMREDPRVTRIGAALRRRSLDELPQLVNVLRGEMSLIGPRPALPHEVEAYDEQARRRLIAIPGMTGLCQVSGRSDLAWEDAIRLDLHYVDEWSPAMDRRILAKTFQVVIRPDGGY